jgi:iron complex transport system substrate-binding protein
VSFSPALTDLLFDMGLGDHVVGVTNYCMLPSGQTDIPAVGDRTRVSAEAILAVKPDVVLIQQNPQDFGAVRNIAPAVRIEHVRLETLLDVAAAVEQVGGIVGRQDLARSQGKAFTDKIEALRRQAGQQPRAKVLFTLGYERPGTGGAGTFVDEMITLAGGLNAAAERGYTGWPNLNRENILAMAPEVVVCQVAAGQEEQGRQYWQSFGDLPAVKSKRVFVVTDRRWTIPSMRSADLAAQLAEMVRSSDAGQGA